MNRTGTGILYMCFLRKGIAADRPVRLRVEGMYVDALPSGLREVTIRCSHAAILSVLILASIISAILV